MRKIWDIPGGVHPPENKHQSLREGIGRLPLPDQLILPLNQHIGAPARPLVAVGDRVLKGQMIAEPVGFISAAIHAPTSGTVSDIGDYQVPHPSGMSTLCVVIVPDGSESWVEHEGLLQYAEAEPELIHERIRQAGITGLGGAGFPTSAKLGPLHPIDTLIINGTECEPYITADDILMRTHPQQLIEGIKILRRVLGNPANVLIGIEDNKPKAVEAMEAAAADTDFEVIEFPTKYPSGGEKQLIQILTGHEVPSGKLPADLGIVCHNLGTAHAIYRAVALGEPLISRITTVTGKACGINRNYEVLIGTPVSHLLRHNDFDDRACTRLVMGGPMMGFTLPDTAVPVIKATNCILACSDEESPLVPAPAQACIRCGLCAEACPASLLPQQLYWYSQARDFDKVQAYNLFDCIECGACSYVCPSNIPLVQYYRATKGELRKQAAEKRKSDHARQRFEFHQARLERAEAEKAAKREARRQAALEAQKKADQAAPATPGAEAATAAKKGSADDLIKAAMARAEAKKASPEHQQAKLERGVDAAKNRLAFAEEKLAEDTAGEQRESLQVKVDEARRKLAEAEQKLAAFAQSGSVPQPAGDSEARVADKLQATPGDQLTKKIATLKDKIATTEAKLAETDDESVKAALEKGLEKQRTKLSEAEEELAHTPGGEADAPAEDPQTADAAARAIARAREKASAMAEMSPAEKLDATIDSLESRVAKARDKLAEARAENAEHSDALASGLEKLEAKLTAAREERRQLTEQEQS